MSDEARSQIMNNGSGDLRAIFERALELITPDERARYLAEACGGDADLRREVESLLRVSPTADAFMETPAAQRILLDETIVVERPGTSIGPYERVERLGEGGMGVVYRARQTRPIRRDVALKIMKPARNPERVIARFESERQALALLDHPHIARVLDAGTTES